MSNRIRSGVMSFLLRKVYPVSNAETGLIVSNFRVIQPYRPAANLERQRHITGEEIDDGSGNNVLLNVNKEVRKINNSLAGVYHYLPAHGAI